MKISFFLIVILFLKLYTAEAQISADSLSIQNDTTDIDTTITNEEVIDTEDALQESESISESTQERSVNTNYNYLNLVINVPEYIVNRPVEEGETLEFKVFASGGKDQNYSFDLIEGKNFDMALDSVGKFSWTPDFEFVNRIEKEKTASALIEVTNDSGQISRKAIDIKVLHVNRPPEIGDLKNMYVKYNEENTYKIDLNTIIDPDQDPLVFKPIPIIMPEGSNLTENGIFTWKPSLRQFNRLKSEPLRLSFLVEDQPYKAQVKGSFNILVTQMDLPPEITMIPKNEHVISKENETINFKFFLSDPNGDEDISDFNLVSEDLRITKDFLIQNAQTQYEFIWTPGYDFVRDVEDSIQVELSFYVVDDTYLRDEEKVSITIINTKNQIKIDKELYSTYRSGLVRIWDLYEQLKIKEKEYYKKLKKARKTKKGIAITDASLGAVTALSPLVITENQQTQKIVTGVGGTTVMTMGTLEAADVIAKSPSELIQKLNRVIEKKNELLMHGNVYARRYSTTLSRRDKDFIEDTEKLLSRLIMKEVATLELTAGWENPKRAKDENLRSTFPDFVPSETL